MYRTNAYVSPRPARSGAHLALGITAVALTSVVALGSVGYLLYRTGARHGAATVRAETSAKPAPPTVSAIPSAPPAPVESTIASPTAPDDDEVTPAPTSHRASSKARPSWTAEAYAPQPSQPLELFVRATPITSGLDHGYVICRFQSFNKHDTFAGDDLHVRATFGAMPRMMADGPEDANLGFVSAPLVSLKKGDKVKFEVYDRDVFGMATITKPTTPFAMPLESTDDGANIECRTLEAPTLAETVRSYGTRADGAIARVARDPIDPYSPEWSPNHYEQASAQRATEDVAALVGWADPRVAKRLATLDAALSSLASQRHQAFDTLHEAARDRVTFNHFDVAIGEVTCTGRGDGSCTVHLSVTNHDRRDTLHFGGFLSPFAYAATAESGPMRMNGGGEIAPGATADIALVSTGPELTTRRSIVGICEGSRCAPLRVR